MNLTRLLSKTWNNIRDVVVSPTTAIKRITEEKDYIPAILTVFLAAACFTPYQLLLYVQLFAPMMLMYAMIVRYVSYFTVRHLFHGGEELDIDKHDISVVMAYTMVPWICFLPFALLEATLLVLFVGLLWSFVLTVLIVHETYEIGVRASVCVTLFSIFGFLVFVAITYAAAFWFIFTNR